MADKTITALTGASTPLAGTEVLPIVQSGATVKVATNDLTVRNVRANATTGILQVVGPTTGTTRVMTTPDANFTVARIDATQSFTGDQTLATGNLSFATSGKGITTGSAIPLGFGTNAGTAAMTLNTNGSFSTGPILANNGAGGTSSFSSVTYSNLGIIGTSDGRTGGGSQLNFTTTGHRDWVVGQRNDAAYAADSAFFIRDETAAATRLTIDTSGIVTMSAYGAGAATFSAAGVISSVSDENWKRKDGVPANPTEMLGKLQPGYWYYNDEKKDTFGVDRQLGFYAQNVNVAIGPEAAPEPEEGKPWGYYDRSVLAVVVLSLQKALSTIDSLTERIVALEAK